MIPCNGHAGQTCPLTRFCVENFKVGDTPSCCESACNVNALTYSRDAARSSRRSHWPDGVQAILRRIVLPSIAIDDRGSNANRTKDVKLPPGCGHVAVIGSSFYGKSREFPPRINTRIIPKQSVSGTRGGETANDIDESVDRCTGHLCCFQRIRRTLFPDARDLAD